MARRKGRPISGILLLNKPKGISSNAALQSVKRWYKASKAGHTGSLDPLAEGLLPICFGKATRLSAFLLDADKTYQVEIRLGQITSTGDAEGELIEERDYSTIDMEQINAVLLNFTGPIEQIPPMYSAVKYQGKRLYELAREGKTVPRQPRLIHIYHIELLKFEPPFLLVNIHCSKGTYIRTLAEDIGQALGCGAHISALTRTQVGPYQDKMYSMDELKSIKDEQGLSGLDQILLPLDSGLAQYPEVKLSANSQFYIQQGQAVQVPKAPLQGRVRLYDQNKKFIGVGEINEDGLVAPKRLF